MVPKVYRTLEDFFVPLMQMTYNRVLGGGLLHSWSMGVQVSVPKAGLSNSVSQIRPPTIVNVMLKWISTVLYLQVEDVISQMVPP